MIITIQPKFEKHSEYRGITIYKRKANCGTSGGMWMAKSTMFKTLARLKSYIDYYEQN